MKKLITLTLAALAFNLNATEIKTNNEQVNKVLKNTVYINVGGHQGTGFLIKDLNLVVTNKHVANEKSKFIGLLTSDNNIYYGQFKYKSDKYDLALIQVFDKNDTLQDNKTDIRYNGGLSLCDSTDNIYINQEIFSFGSPMGQRHTFRKGYINSPVSYNTQFKQKLLTYQEYQGGGFSGSPVYSSDFGCVLGVHFAGNPQYQAGLGIPVENLKEFLKEYNYIKDLTKNELIIYELSKERKRILKELDIKQKQIEEINKKIKKIHNNSTMIVDMVR